MSVSYTNEHSYHVVLTWAALVIFKVTEYILNRAHSCLKFISFSFKRRRLKQKIIFSPFTESLLKVIYSCTFMARTSLIPWKFVQHMGSSSHGGLIIVKQGYVIEGRSYKPSKQ